MAKPSPHRAHAANGRGCSVVTCNYAPPGNYNNEYANNVHPLAGGIACAKCLIPQSLGGCKCNGNCACVSSNQAPRAENGTVAADALTAAVRGAAPAVAELLVQ